MEEEYEYEEILADGQYEEIDGEQVVYVTEDYEPVYDEDSNVFHEEYVTAQEEYDYDKIVEEGYGEVNQETRLAMFPDNYSVKSKRRVGPMRPDPIEDRDERRKAEEKAPNDEEQLSYMTACTYDMSITRQIRKELNRHNAMRAGIVCDEEEILEKPPTGEAAAAVAECDEATFDLTPLPDKYFVRRATGDASSVGLHAVAAMCEACRFCFRTKTAHSKHVSSHKTANPETNLLPRTQILCPVTPCDVRSDCLATLVEHVRLHHGHDEMVFESIEFSDIDQFKKWKSEMERLTMTRYTRSSGKHNVFSKSTYYHCHQSGNAPTQKEGNTLLRNRASKKLGKSCTAFFHIKEKEDGKVSLRGCVKHVGHDLNVRSMPISDEIKKEIAQLIIQGMNEHDIVDLLRDNSESTDRRHYVQPYEVRNVQTKVIKHQFDMARQESSGQPRNYMSMDDIEYEEGDEIDVVSEQHIRKHTKDDNSQDADYNEAPPYAAVEEVATSEYVEDFRTDANMAEEKKPAKPTKSRKRKLVKKLAKPDVKPEVELEVKPEEKPEGVVATVAVTKEQAINPRAFTRRKYDLITGLPARRGPKTKVYKQIIAEKSLEGNKKKDGKK